MLKSNMWSGENCSGFCSFVLSYSYALKSYSMLENFYFRQKIRILWPRAGEMQLRFVHWKKKLQKNQNDTESVKKKVKESQEEGESKNVNIILSSIFWLSLAPPKGSHSVSQSLRPGHILTLRINNVQYWVMYWKYSHL